MESKKAQLTIFAIVGIVILLLAGSLFFLSNISEKKKAGGQATKVQKSTLSAQPVQKYIQGCLEKTVKEGLTLIGSQGGYAYSSQGGTLEDFGDNEEGIFYIRYNNHKVPYLITGQERDFGKYFATAPQYPWTTFPLINDSTTEAKYTGIFGMSNLAPINSSFGPHSMEDQLEVYIKNNLKKCIEWANFENEFDIRSSTNPSTVEAHFARDDTFVKMEFPVKITSKATGDEAELSEFASRQAIRMQRIYYAAQKIINEETQNAQSDAEKVALEAGFSAETQRSLFGNDDLIIVRDQNSLIGTKPYEFIFSRKNRMPALRYVTPLQKTVAADISTPSRMFVREEDVAPGGIAGLMADDPDEDTVAFSITPDVNMEYWLESVVFRITATDGELEDYQEITIIRG